MAGTLEVPVVGEKNSTGDPKYNTGLTTFNNLLNASNKIAAASLENAITNTQLSGSAGITRANLAAESKPFTWYTPKVIATEETRENVAFGKLTTADEITEVVLPTNGLLVVGYTAIVKSSVGGAGKAAIFIGANQLKVPGSTVPVVQEASTVSTVFSTLNTTPMGIGEAGVGTSYVTTGQALTDLTHIGGLCYIFAAASTYAISVQFRSTSGTITAKERKLWVATLGY